MIQCRCGMNIDDEMANSVCPRCGMQYPGRDYQAAHIPARPEVEEGSLERLFCRECGGKLDEVEREEYSPLCYYCSPKGRALQVAENKPASNARYMRRCPECEQGELIPSEGCSMCPVCGFGYCG